MCAEKEFLCPPGVFCGSAVCLIPSPVPYPDSSVTDVGACCSSDHRVALGQGAERDAASRDGGRRVEGFHVGHSRGDNGAKQEHPNMHAAGFRKHRHLHLGRADVPSFAVRDRAVLSGLQPGPD